MNPVPNRTLAKIGFEFVKQYDTHPRIDQFLPNGQSMGFNQREVVAVQFILIHVSAIDLF